MIDQEVRIPADPAHHRVDGEGPTGLVLVAALVAMALVAGLIFTFSVAVMPNLAERRRPHLRGDHAAVQRRTRCSRSASPLRWC